MEYSYESIVLGSQNPIDFALWLHEEGFITVAGVSCNKCGKRMFLQESARYKGDGVCLRCENNKCRHYQSVRKGSFFKGKGFSMADQMKLLVLFVCDTPVTAAAHLLHKNRNAVGQFYDRCRNVWAQQRSMEPIKFIDSNGEYECDEMILKRVVMDSELLIEIQWIAGVVEQVCVVSCE